MPDSKITLFSQICAPAYNLARNLKAGLRLFLFMPVTPGVFVFSTGQAILLLGLVVAIPVGYEAARYWPIGDVHAYGLGVILVRLVTLLAVVHVSAWTLPRFLNQFSKRRNTHGVSIDSQNSDGEAQVMILAGLVWAHAGWIVVIGFAPWPDLPFYAGIVAPLALIGIWGLVASRVLRLATGAPWLVAFACGAVAVLAVIISVRLIGSTPVFSRGGVMWE